MELTVENFLRAGTLTMTPGRHPEGVTWEGIARKRLNDALSGRVEEDGEDRYLVSLLDVSRTHTHAHTDTCPHKHAQTHTDTDTHAHTRAYARAHTYTHTHTHTGESD